MECSVSMNQNLASEAIILNALSVTKATTEQGNYSLIIMFAAEA